MSNYGYWNDPLFIDRIARSLKQNHVIAGTSDTVLGLLAPLTSQGKQAIDAIKVRERKPYLVLVSSLAKAKEFSDSFSDSKVQSLAKKYWPGPLTLVLPAKEDIPDFICSSERTIALRIPDHPGLLQLLASFDGLFSTSANLSGQPVPDSIEQLDPMIKQKVELLVDDRQRKQN